MDIELLNNLIQQNQQLMTQHQQLMAQNQQLMNVIQAGIHPNNNAPPAPAPPPNPPTPKVDPPKFDGNRNQADNFRDKMSLFLQLNPNMFNDEAQAITWIGTLLSDIDFPGKTDSNNPSSDQHIKNLHEGWNSIRTALESARPIQKAS
eukprot:TRINITY_DN9038_c0_g1_i2.p1 TRINITY_DN9038_c0_g1~~TRINITY_DN9038_c0_g1_i2.p1  ORF type:complete len:148 (+),score=30.31 TRINITY_DN9038_c0_g1_i2:150-593(+)